MLNLIRINSKIDDNGLCNVFLELRVDSVYQ